MSIAVIGSCAELGGLGRVRDSRIESGEPERSAEDESGLKSAATALATSTVACGSGASSNCNRLGAARRRRDPGLQERTIKRNYTILQFAGKAVTQGKRSSGLCLLERINRTRGLQKFQRKVDLRSRIHEIDEPVPQSPFDWHASSSTGLPLVRHEKARRSRRPGLHLWRWPVRWPFRRRGAGSRG